MTRRTLTIAVVYPDLLGTYGDGGNGLVLAQRARWRGIGAELLDATSDLTLPTADLYCLGGGEDGPQARAATLLAADGTLARAFADGAVVLAVCAGFQIVGASYPGADGRALPGLGLADFTTVKGSGRRAVGELVAAVVPQPELAQGQLPALTGFENHAGVTTLGTATGRLATVVVGTGNGGGDGSEGALSGRLVGTYLHGPILARNPALADRLLSLATGSDQMVEPLDDATEQLLRAERLAVASRSKRRWPASRWRR